MMSEDLLLSARLTPVQWRALLAWAAEQGPDVYDALERVHRRAMAAV